MKKAFLAILIFGKAAMAQPNVNYNDVAVIVNDNSQSSQDIANYFKVKRNIPAQNIIHINCSINEEIDSTTFSQIRIQIENGLTNLPNLNDINYLVTTKGLPLKVLNDDITISPSLGKSASFDAELSLILGNYAYSIANWNNPMNPFASAQGHFTRNQYGIFMVTRLDAYTTSDVFNLIDKSGPNTAVNKQASHFIFNYANVSNQAEKNLFFSRMQPAHDTLISKGWVSQIDTSNILAQYYQNILGYFFVYNSLVLNEKPNFLWVNGSITEITSVKSGNTFDSNFAPLDRLLIADLIGEGAAGAHGYVYDVYFNFTLIPEKTFTFYTDTTNHYNLAESFYRGMLRLSDKDVIIGDPKTSIIIDNTVGLSKIENAADIEIYPNPSTDLVFIKSQVKIDSYKLYDSYGNILINKKITTQTNQLSINLKEYVNGIYFIQLFKTDGYALNKRIVKSN
jgi:uncharacterized protein (TIGR03790 family)